MTDRDPAQPRVVLIGCGQIGMLGHLPALSILRDQGVLDLAGVCDLDEKRAEESARRFGVSVWGAEWTHVAQDTGATAVAVCLLPGPNAEVSIGALERGLHVLCEKPPGRDEAQAARMADAAAARPELVTMIAFNRRYAPLYRLAQRRSSEIGPAHSFVARFTRGAIGLDPSTAAADWISSDGSHALDLAVATLGVPHQVTVARKGVGAGPDNAWLIQLLSNRGQAVVWLDFAAGRRLERFEWAGPGYDVSLELPDQGGWTHRGGTESWKASEISGSGEFAVNYGFVDEYRAFAEAITGRATRPEADFAYGAVFMKLIGQILSSRSGETRRLAVAAVSESPRVSSSAPARSLPGTTKRPVVAVLQPAAAVRRYLPAGLLAETATCCDFRFPSEADPFAGVSDADAVLLGWGAPALPGNLAMSADRLRLAIVLGASVRWALPDALLDSGRVSVCNTADAIAQSVAEHCLLLTLAGLRRLTEVDGAMHRGEWPPRGRRGDALRRFASRAGRSSLLRPLGSRLKPAAKRALARVGGEPDDAWNDLRGQTVGLVGWGQIARRFAELLEPFDCRLLVCSDHIGAEDLERFGARQASLGETLAASRVVSLHKGMTDRSRGMIGRELLATLPKSSVFVNTARAGLVDENALIERARKGDVVLALDVFHQEPLPKRHPLRGLRNVILSPHSAGSTPQCALRVGAQALELLARWASGQEIPVLDPARLAEMT